ncbi:diacylglycerol kinase catalytic domain-containing protein [Colletotrichum truncatum]|uniref:Diacylglycerol kinase catalytic domain-containing protein n=1 Tax=Colletotrichum truncatum TaxID=5467 RepID=A0ACC3YN87_COLTU|nr:diacylglycerol kinase catalytic domain-containing protein [Colletotrichum truncatum]KAF6792163.1 diacylglycerol kinase catalytic domain-containing protein [Colletotrichum truncatum]
MDVAEPLGFEPRDHGLVPRRALDATFIDGKLSFTSQRGTESVRPEEIVFIIPKNDQVNSSPIICALREDPDTKEFPYQLDIFFVSGDLPPELTNGLLLSHFPDHLSPRPGHHDVHFVVSTKSGLGHAPKFWDNVVQPLVILADQKTSGNPSSSSVTDGVPSQYGSNLLDKCNIVVTKDADSVRNFAKERWAARPQVAAETSPTKSEVIVLLSGDGGVVDLLNGCEETDTPTALPTLALLPLGTGNAMFHSSHKPLYTENGPSHMVLGLRTLFFGTAAPLPSFRASFSSGARLVTYTPTPDAQNPEDVTRHDASVGYLFGAIVASYGFHAQLVWESDTPEYRKHGSKRFGMVAQELLKESHAYAAQVEIRGPDGGPLRSVPREKFGYALATIVSNLEKTFTISPGSGPLQGRLKLVHFGAVGGEKTMEIMMAAYKQGSHVGMRWKNGEDEDYVGYEDAEEIKVSIGESDPRWRKVCIDGTIVEIPEGGWMAVTKLRNPLYNILADRSVL